MRRGFLAFVVLLPFIATASAQSPAPRSTLPILRVTTPAVVAAASLETVVDRVMVFDRNHDGRLTKGELLERMQPLVVRGDADGDGVLDNSEIRMLATTRPAATIPKEFQPGTYGFADQTGLSTRSHIENSIDDLRLPVDTREQALAVVNSFLDSLQVSAAATLQKKMAKVLTAEQLAGFKTLLDRQRRSGVALASNGDSHRTLMEQNLRMLVFASDLERRVASFKLAPAALRQAQTAIQQYRNTLRLGDTERAALMVQLAGVLDDEERENLGAALKRRPVVKTGNTPRVFAASQRIQGVQGDVVRFRNIPAAAMPDFQLLLLDPQKTAVLEPASVR
ncbi:MAG TPA: hypothetical protein VFV95_15095 [Vicinamibacterales bacterium]|nr:hypothetical protein [Vicinamibacterales bacterium]